MCNSDVKFVLSNSLLIKSKNYIHFLAKNSTIDNQIDITIKTYIQVCKQY